MRRSATETFLVAAMLATMGGLPTPRKQTAPVLDPAITRAERLYQEASRLAYRLHRKAAKNKALKPLAERAMKRAGRRFRVWRELTG